MLDDIERRRFLVEPAREHASPAFVGLLDVELDERAGQGRRLPRSSRLAGAKADDRVAHAQRLAGLHRQVADDAVALVEQPDHRDAIGHRRLADILQRCALTRIDQRRLRLLIADGAIASTKQHRRGGEHESGAAHPYSGVQAW